MRALTRRKTTVYTVTDAARPRSEDVDERQRHYLISMSIRTLCLVLAVALWGRVHPVLLGLLLVGAILLPYVSVVFANGGPKPNPRSPAVDLFEHRALPTAQQPHRPPENPEPNAGSGANPETTP